MFHPMVAGVTIPGIGIFGLMLAPLHRPQPQQEARGPQVRHRPVHLVPHVLGRPRHHRLVLPGPGLQLHPPVARRPVLRPVDEEPLVSAGTVLGIVIAGVVLLAVLLLFTTARRRDENRAVGRLSRETRDRDRSERATAEALGDLEPTAAHRPRGRAGRRRRAPRAQGRAARHDRSAAAACGRPLDEETLGVTRRQFLNRGIVTCSRSGWPASAGRCSPSSGRRCPAASARRSRPAASTTSSARSTDKKEPFYVAEGRFYINPYPKDDVAKAKAVAAYGAVLDGLRGRRRRALPEVRAPRLPRAVVQDVAVVRVPVPRLAVQPRRREEGRSRAARPRPLRVSVDGGIVDRRHQGDHRRARRSAPTPRARRPRAPTAYERALARPRGCHASSRSASASPS